MYIDVKNEKKITAIMWGTEHRGQQGLLSFSWISRAEELLYGYDEISMLDTSQVPVQM